MTPISDPPILLYHRICRDDEWQPSDFLVAETVFREQMKFLARGNYCTVRLSEVLGWNGLAPHKVLGWNGVAPHKVLGWNGVAPHNGKTPVVLTFDDGFADTYEIAFPILQELGFTAAVFPVLDLRRRFGSWATDTAMRGPLMTPEHMRAMAAAGIEFGSHTMSHPSLPLLSDAEIMEELTRSREVLGSVVSRPLPVLAYPYGEVNLRVKRAVQASGYSAALAVNSGPLAIQADPFEIRRVCVTNLSSDAYMRFTASSAAKLYRWFRWKAREGIRSTRSWTASRRASVAP